MISIVVAHADNLVIGKDNDLPWYIPEDLKHFKHLTENHTVIMGRNTYNSILSRISKPLPNRTSIIISSTLDDPRVTVVKSVEGALSVIKDDDEVFVIGGSRLYREFLDRNLVDKMYITQVQAEVIGDTYFPSYSNDEWTITSSVPSGDNNYKYEFNVYERKSTK